MANKTETATLDASNDPMPDRVVIWGRDPNGVLRPISIDTSGNIGGGASNPSGDGASNTGTSTQVASATSPTTILAANAARYGATVFNDDANTLYLLLGSGTVSATVYTVQVLSGDYFPVPYGFTGIITGLWAADGSGSARVTEFT